MVNFKILHAPLKTLTSLFGMLKWLLDAVTADAKHCMPSCTVCVILHLFVSLGSGTTAAGEGTMHEVCRRREVVCSATFACREEH